MPGNQCEHCTATCCRYIALPIDNPETPADFDDIRWYLIHDNVSVFVEDGEWYICFQTACRHLLPDQRCAIHPARPRICRKYTSADCDYHSGDYHWEQHFTSPEHLDEYLRHRGAARASATRGAKADRRRPAVTRGRQLDRHSVPLPVLE